MERVKVLASTNELKSLMTILRDINTPRHEWVFTADRVIRLIVEEGLNTLPFTKKVVTTPTGKIE